MRNRRRSSIFVFAAVVVLLALGLGAEQSFVHTDDGCAVEIHCLACRLAVAGPAVVVAALDLAPRAVLVSTVPVAPQSADIERAPRTFAPRGPPLT
jgi:hypothetical protein